MPGAALRVQGLSQLRRDLKRFAADTADLKAANMAVGGIVAAAAATRAPRRTGRLAASLRPTRTVGRASVRSTVPYAVYQHWSKRYGHPFVTEAAEATEPAWLAAYVAGLEQAVNRFHGATH